MSTISIARPLAGRQSFVERINTSGHEKALWIYLTIVVAHWLEHIVQAFQVWVLDMPRPESLGILGLPFPWLVKSETMHFTYAVLMFVGLVMLRRGFVGSARTWWTVSLAIQGWHLVEHSVLQGQAILGLNLFNSPVPSSILQVWIPRVELHLLYNGAVFLPMVVAMWLHTRPTQAHANQLQCSCANP